MKAYLIFDDSEKQTRFTERVWEYIKAKGKEIEIPDDVNDVAVGWMKGGALCVPFPVTIPIPRPKSKVKKTVYLCVKQYDGRPVYSGFDINEPPEGSYPVEIEVEE